MSQHPKRGFNFHSTPLQSGSANEEAKDNPSLLTCNTVIQSELRGTDRHFVLQLNHVQGVGQEQQTRIVELLYTKTSEGQVTNLRFKIIGGTTKYRKVTPSWLSKQRLLLIKQLVVHIFSVSSSTFDGCKGKPDVIKRLVSEESITFL